MIITIETMGELDSFKAMLYHVIVASFQAIIVYGHWINNSNGNNSLIETAKNSCEHCTLSLLENKYPKVCSGVRGSNIKFISTTTASEHQMVNHLKILNTHNQGFKIIASSYDMLLSSSNNKNQQIAK